MTRVLKDKLPYYLFVGTGSTASHITAAWVQPGGKPGSPMTFAPTPGGIGTLQQQLSATGIAPARTLVVPHTSHPTWLDLAGTLARAGYAISPINPARARALAGTLLQTGDSDTIDAGTLAHLAALLQPSPWLPTAATAARVQRFLDERATLLDLLQRLEQQRTTADPRHFDALHTGMRTQLRDLEQRLIGLLSNDAAWAAAAQRLAHLSDQGLMAALWQAITTRTPQSFDLLRGASSRYLPQNPRRALLHFSRPFAIATLALALTAGPALPAAMAQDGSNLDRPQQATISVVNDTIPGDQADSAIAIDATSNTIVVAWESEGSSNDGIVMKGYGGTGTTIFGETQVFTDTASLDANTPDVAMDDDGDFVVTWQKSITDTTAIMAQRYTSAGLTAGNPITLTEEFVVDDSVSDPAVAMDDAGNFVAAWYEYDSGTDKIVTAAYNSAGALQSGPTEVDTADTSNQERVSSPDVGMDDDGNFVVVWDGSYYDTSSGDRNYYIYAQRYTAAGAPSGSLQTLATVTAGSGDTSYVRNPAADMNSTGTLAAAWEEYDASASSYYLVYVSYDTSGTQVVNENVPVNTSFGNTENAAVTIDDTGTVIAVAESLTTGGDDIIFYESSASPGNFVFATRISQTADAPAIESDSDGDFIITWDGYSDSTATQEILAWNLPASASTAPVVNATDSALNYTTSSGAVDIDPSIAVSDPDSTDLISATIEISGGFVSGEDTLDVPASLPTGITVSTATADTITLTGMVAVADYQTALSGITYENTAATPTTGTRTVTFTVGDGTDTGSDTRDIVVAGANVAPQVDVDGSALAYTEGDGLVPVDSSVTVVDTGNVLSATVEITGSFNSGEDVLDVSGTLPGSITADTTVAGKVALSGEASASDYQDALRLIAYSNTSDDPDTTMRTVSFTVEDVGNETGSATRDIDIAAENDAPVVTTASNSLGYIQGAGAVVVDPTIEVDDLDNTNLMSATVEISSGFVSGEDMLDVSGTLPGSITASMPTSGTIVLTGTTTVANYQDALRQITYTNNANPLTNGTRTVTFTAYDPEGAEGNGTRDITVGTQNDAPTVTASASALVYTEGDAPTLIDPNVVVQDTNDTDLESATIEITGSFVGAEDELSVAGALPVGITADTSVSGTITLTGTASVTDYQTALRQVAYENTSDNPDTTPRTVTFTVNDGIDSGSDTRDITITAENDAPTVTNTATTLTYTAGDGQVVIDPGTMVDDIDDTNLMTATVEITGGFVDTEDELSVSGTLPGGITADTSVSGTITLTGTATITDYQAALRQIAYENSADPLTEGMRTVTFTVYDPEGAESSDVRMIEVQNTPSYEIYLPFVAN